MYTTKENTNIGIIKQHDIITNYFVKVSSILHTYGQ